MMEWQQGGDFDLFRSRQEQISSQYFIATLEPLHTFVKHVSSEYDARTTHGFAILFSTDMKITFTAHTEDILSEPKIQTTPMPYVRMGLKYVRMEAGLHLVDDDKYILNRHDERPERSIYIEDVWGCYNDGEDWVEYLDLWEVKHYLDNGASIIDRPISSHIT